MQKILKIIHYCWFGGNPLPPLALKCIESWKKYCPDYEIKEWNENNFNVNFNNYTKEAYEAKKWAFVSDVARLWIVYNHGGIYFDTDVEIIKSLDNFLNDNMFVGFESDKFIATGLGFGAEKNHNTVKKMLEMYDDLSFVKPNGEFNTIPCPVYNTKILKQEGFIINNTRQSLNNTTLYPTEYFCPKNNITNTLKITKNTHAIHHFNGSWLTEEQKKEHIIIAKYKKKYGRQLGGILYAIVALCTFRKTGINNVIRKLRCK